MNDQHDPAEQKATEQPQQTEAAVPEPEPVAAPGAAEPEPTPEAIEAEVEAPPAEEETEHPEAPPQVSAERAEAERAPAEDGCWVPMREEGPLCMRPIHQAPAGVDEQPVCLMHSKDPAKSDEEFQKEFERILAAAGDGVADFTGFVFPRSTYQERKFAACCTFDRATFTQGADFSGARFTQDASFRGAAFAKAASFIRATFTQRADFSAAAFTQAAHFIGATFTQHAIFSVATFTQGASFFGARFTQDAIFSGATFTQRADFNWATFTQAATFRVATFTQDADFSGAAFAGSADFRDAVFTGPARFAPLAKSEGEEAKPCEFKNRVLFQDARFQDYADFREAVFGESGSSTARPVFSLARFEKPERVTFYKTWLGQTLFVNCDVSKLNFSGVEWGRCGSRRQLYEETVPLDGEAAEPLKPPPGSHDERNYHLIAETYHQLKKNYDSRGDPWRANDFHYGEMEMLRLSSHWPRIGLTAIYKHLSQYGLSVKRPAVCLAIVLLLCTLLYPLAGLRPRTQTVPPAPQVKPITYWNLPEATGWVPRPVRLWRHSAMTTLAVASLQREAAYYEPHYGWGRFLGILELALTSTLAALFILAVRRQFKRGGD
jgi:uncharacterized protein YjbI with pentapeptide repeats